MSRGTVALLEAIAPRLGVRLGTTTADAARFPGPDGLADTVLAVHLLEHLEPAHGAQVVAEALRLAVRRVVVAVPLEDEANETYGHVRTVSLDDLCRWGRSTGLACDVHEFHGGWLVIDKAPTCSRTTAPTTAPGGSSRESGRSSSRWSTSTASRSPASARSRWVTSSRSTTR